MFTKSLMVTYEPEKHAKMCDMVRRAMMCFYRRRIYTSFMSYLHKKFDRSVGEKYQGCLKSKKKQPTELEKDVMVRTDALIRASGSSYWE